MIVYSIETLYHFSCPECNKWWSIADWEITHEITCPLCCHSDDAAFIGDVEDVEDDKPTLD